MFLRIVEATVRENKNRQLESAYRDQVLSDLERTEGCLFAGLLQSTDMSGTYMSLTLWDAQEHIRKYTDSGDFERNLEHVRPWIESSSEWKIQLSKDDMIEYVPSGSDHVVKSYPVDDEQNMLSGQVTEGRSYLRVLSLKIQPGKEEDFKSIYHKQIQKELEKTDGCRLAFLVDNSATDNEMLSFTVWDSLEAVMLYENEGIFNKLLNKAKHTLAELYQWKMALDSRGDPPKAVTSRDLDISKFTLVTGKRFK